MSEMKVVPLFYTTIWCQALSDGNISSLNIARVYKLES